MKYQLRLEYDDEPLAVFDTEEEANQNKWKYQQDFISRTVLVEPCN